MSYATRSRQNSISSPEEIYMPDEDNDVKKGAVESENRFVTPEEAVTMILNVGRLYQVLSSGASP